MDVESQVYAKWVSRSQQVEKEFDVTEAREQAKRGAAIPAQTPFRHPQGHSTTQLPLMSSV
jgi:hypothetical protein